MRNNLLIRCLLRRNLGAAVLGTAISTMNTVIDSFLMGNLLGADALSAINLSLPLSYALVTVQCIMASGASLLVSKKLGERQTSRADEIFTVSLASLFIAGLALTLLAPLIANPIAGLLCSQTSLMENCRDYCRAELFCALPIMFQIALSSFAQRTGNPKLVLKANLASLAVNIAMDVWYVSVLRLGMTGAALATGTGAIAAVAVVLADFARKKPVRLRWPKKGALGMLLFNMGSGMTGAAQTVAISVLTYVLNYFIQRTEGADGVFVLSVGMIFLGLSLFFAMGAQTVLTSMGSMMRGQGDHTGLRMLFKSVMKLTMLITCIPVLIQLLFPKQLAGVFGANTETQLKMAGMGLRILSLYSILLAFLLIMISDYQVLGHFYLASLTAFGMLAMLPLNLWLMETCLPPEYIWYAMPLSSLITGLLMLLASALFRKKKGGALSFFTLLPKETEEKKVFEGTVELRLGSRESLTQFTEQMIPFFESLQIDRRTSFRIRLCVEEMLDFIAIRAKQKNDIADVRIVATEREVSVLLRDNLPPYNPLVGEDCQTNRKILQAFCPKMDYQNAFLQNVVIMDWNDLSRRL